MSNVARIPTTPPARADCTLDHRPVAICTSRPEREPLAEKGPFWISRVGAEVPHVRCLLRDLDNAASASRTHADGEPESVAQPRKRARPSSPEKPPRPVPSSPPSKAATPPWKPKRALVRALELPLGAATGDRIRLFDIKNRKKTDYVFDVPEGAHDGMKLDFMEPGDSYRLVFEDCNGFIAGGSAISQHGTRLRFHRKTCKFKGCPVMGCGGDSSCILFDSAADDETCRRFEAHAKVANKRGIQFQINRLRARTCR